MAYRIETVMVRNSPMEVFMFMPAGKGPHAGRVSHRARFTPHNTGHCHSAVGIANYQSLGCQFNIGTIQ